MNILTPMRVFVIIMALRNVSSYTETCIQEYCFTTPDASQLTDFNGAKTWCTNNGSTLAVINNSDAQQALTQFLNSSNTNSMAFINVKLYQHEQTWFLVNGSRYLGFVWYQDTTSYKLYCCLKPGWNGAQNFKVFASKPDEINRYICEFQGARCLNNSNDNILYNGRCYVKYENESLTWYQARERCYNSGGDLASFQSDPLNTWNPQLNTSWLSLSLTYWVGIRWNEWRWNTPDGGNEAIYTSWSSGEPNNYAHECVCADPNGNPVWSWTDCSCGDPKQFVCLKIVPTTTASTTSTTTSATRAPTISTSSEVIPVSNQNSTINALAIGLGAGIGGGVFIIVLVVLIVVVVIVMKKRRRKNSGVESRRKDENQGTATPDTNRPTELEASSDQSGFYAHIVPTTQHPADNKSQNEVIYAKPEFPNSTPSVYDPNTIRQGRVQSIMLEGPSDFYANAASVS